MTTNLCPLRSDPQPALACCFAGSAICRQLAAAPDPQAAMAALADTHIVTIRRREAPADCPIVQAAQP